MKNFIVLLLTIVSFSFGIASVPNAVQAQAVYIPSIWVDPDGFEHWVMDDGAEGYMTPHVTRDGRPVCNGSGICGLVSSDQFFKTNSARIGQTGRAELERYFRNAGGQKFSIQGHTDSRASDAYNQKLSLARAQAVADIARRSGVEVVDVLGFGETRPRASNATSEGMAKNRRVEIFCVN